MTHDEFTFECCCGCNIDLTCDRCGCEMQAHDLATANRLAGEHVCEPIEANQ